MLCEIRLEIKISFFFSLYISSNVSSNIFLLRIKEIQTIKLGGLEEDHLKYSRKQRFCEKFKDKMEKYLTDFEPNGK